MGILRAVTSPPHIIQKLCK